MNFTPGVLEQFLVSSGTKKQFINEPRTYWRVTATLVAALLMALVRATNPYILSLGY